MQFNFDSRALYNELLKCIFSRLGMHARFQSLYGCDGIYYGSYYFGSVRDYLLSGI